MAESITDVVVGIILLISVVVIVATHYHRERQQARWLQRMHNNRLWDKLRHRH